MARRNDHSRDELKQLALEAAEKVIDEQGYPALSARKVAAAIGYTAGTLYQVFTNLDDLCWHINARTMHQLQAQLDSALSTVLDLSAAQQLKQIGLVYLHFSQQWPNRWSLMFDHSTPDDISSPDWLNQAIQQLFDAVEKPLRMLQPHGSTKQLQHAVRVLWCGVHGIATLNLGHKLFLPDNTTTEQLLDNLLKNYLTGWQEGA